MERNHAFYMVFFFFFTVFMLFISLQTAHIFNATHHELEIPVQKDLRHVEGLVLAKFRCLLALKRLKLSLHKEKIHKPLLSAPSPSPSPAPVQSLSPNSHPPAPPPLRTIPFVPRGRSAQNGGGGRRRRRILVAVFVSVGSVTLLILAGLGVVCYLRKLRRHGKSWPVAVKGRRHKNMSMHASPQTSAGSNVGLNPKMDLFHFEALNDDLEQDPFADSVSASKISNQKETPSKSETGHRQRREDEDLSCSVASTREILSVHGSADSIVGYESESGASLSSRKHISNDHQNSSDDESFHSLCGSQSSSIRLSNASVSTLSDPVPTSSPPRDGLIPPPPLPPPPPPPPPFAPFPYPKSYAPPATKFRSNKVVKVNICNDPSEPTPSRTNLPPPPPPPQRPLSSFIPLGESGSPLPKLKPLHWDKVRAEADKSMVWDKLKSSSFRLDEEMIESLFGYNVKNSTCTDDKTKSKTPSPSKHVLEPKRLQNITILSKALNISPEQVCHALLLGTGLSLQQLEALVKMVPTIDEAHKLSTYNGNITQLGSAEQFVKMIISVPLAFCRIEAMLYMETFEDEVLHLNKSFSVLEDACTELRSSKLFLKLLEAVLKTGNRMNVGTIRGGAEAFKLDALLKLSDIKGTDGKTTLLHFVVQEMVRSQGLKEAKTIVGRMNQRNRSMEEREEHYKTMGLELISSLSNELSNVKKTASIDLQVLASSVLNLTQGMAQLQKLVNHDLAADQGGLVESLRSFLEHGERTLKELQDEEKRVLKHVEEITEYFHGALSNKEEANHVKIFVTVRDFLGMLDVVCKELKSLKNSNAPNPLAPFRSS